MKNILQWLTRKKNRKIVGSILVALVALYFSVTKANLPSVFSMDNLEPGEYRVTRIVDGDTIVINSGQKVRYIGIDTPETTKNDCYAFKAKERNSQLVMGKVITMEKDVSEVDKFGRLLRYVYVDDKMINEILVREGYAHAKTFPPDVNYVMLFRVAEQQARLENNGLWKECKP